MPALPPISSSGTKSTCTRLHVLNALRLHVLGAARVDAAIDHGGRKGRRDGPGGGLHRHHVDVRVEHHRGQRAVATGQGADAAEAAAHKLELLKVRNSGVAAEAAEEGDGAAVMGSWLRGVQLQVGAQGGERDRVQRGVRTNDGERGERERGEEKEGEEEE
eukprot:ctg_2515.g507